MLGSFKARRYANKIGVKTISHSSTIYIIYITKIGEKKTTGPPQRHEHRCVQNIPASNCPLVVQHWPWIMAIRWPCGTWAWSKKCAVKINKQLYNVALPTSLWVYRCLCHCILWFCLLRFFSPTSMNPTFFPTSLDPSQTRATSSPPMTASDRNQCADLCT